jgi:hypothetical protein
LSCHAGGEIELVTLSLELLVITLALLGWGELVGWRFSEFRIRNSALAVQSLFGIYVFALIGQVSPLFGGYTHYAGDALLICGVAFFLWFGVANWSWKTWLSTALFVALCVVAGLALSQSVLVNYDSGLYHLPFIHWIAEAGSVPGLANLHYRFGFNSTWLTSAALFSNSPDFSHGPFIWSIAVTVLLYGALLAKGLRALRYGQNICGAFCLMSAALMLVLPINVDFRLLMSTDLSTALFVLHAMAAYIASREAGADHGANDELLALVCAVPLAITSKLSSGPLVLLPMLLLPSLAWGKSRDVFIGVALLLPMVWMTQNLILSGCLAYPVVQTCFDLPWAIDPEKAQSEIAWVTAWARVPRHEPSDPIFAGYAWLQSWLSTHWALLTMLVKIIGLGAALTFTSVMLRPRSTGISVVAWPMVVATLGIVFWFLGAPDPRFGAGFIVALPALALALPLSWFPRWLTGLTLIGLLWYGDQLQNIFRRAHGMGTPLARIELPQPLVSLHTAQGLSVWVPEATDQCWLAARPCTPPGDFNESLARRTFWLREGFTIAR